MTEEHFLETVTEYSVSAHRDQINKITAVRKPILALAELAWNAFDADAARVGIIPGPAHSMA